MQHVDDDMISGIILKRKFYKHFTRIGLLVNLGEINERVVRVSCEANAVPRLKSMLKIGDFIKLKNRSADGDNSFLNISWDSNLNLLLAESQAMKLKHNVDRKQPQPSIPKKEITGKQIENLRSRSLYDKMWGSLSPDASSTAKFLLAHFDGVDFLNEGSGVVDVCGGKGDLSMILAVEGVKSTVVDARSSAGCLSSKHRKWLTKLNVIPAAHVRAFDVLQCWFGSSHRPEEFASDHFVDDSVLEEKLKSCSVIVGLHPDRATGSVQEVALKYGKPYMIVPCCVFYREFPDRVLANMKPVTTCEDLCEYLLSRDLNSTRMKLDFSGANQAIVSLPFQR